ncbi:D-alanyl-D-alanine carboxypeptidase family protein, partial [Myceligenerans pegani]
MSTPSTQERIPPAHARAPGPRDGTRGRRRLTVILLMAVAILLAAAAAYPLIERAAGRAPLTADDVLGSSPEPSGSTGEAGGDIPAGAAGPNDDIPAITRLDPALRAAVRHAADDAHAAGIDLWITSGWRSPAYQQSLYDEAIRTKGLAEARRTVATPETSQHVSGNAVDIGPTEGAYWLIQHGT